MRERHKARVLALQMLYQWEVGKIPPEEVLRTFWSVAPPADEPVRQFASTLVRGTIEHLPAIDQLIADTAEHWRPTRMATMDRLILRLATFELLHIPETPGSVVIDEAIELAKEFSSDDSARFVNGLLDGIKRRLNGTPS
jgi:N utilization substance protein B